MYIIRNSFCPQNINLRLVSITRPSLEWELLEKNMIDEISDLVAQHSEEDDEPIFWYQIGCGVLGWYVSNVQIVDIKREYIQ